MEEEFRSFEKLKAWEHARRFRIAVYAASKAFPKEEQYGLTTQLRRAAISVTANIAEGYGRYHYMENIQFCRQTRGSLNEALDHLYTALDQGYLSQSDFELLQKQGRETERILNGYINWLMAQAKERSVQPQRAKESTILYSTGVLEIEPPDDLP